MKPTVTSAMLAAAIAFGAILPAAAQEHGPVPEAGRKAPPQMGGNPGLKVAQRLAVLETYIGITAEQEPAWRGYTDALIAFAETGARPGKDAPPRLLGEMIADKAIAKGQRAERLQAAAANLRAALSEDQLERLIRAEAPPKGARGPREPGDPGDHGMRGAKGPDLPPAEAEAP